MVGRATSEVALQRDNRRERGREREREKGGAFAWRVFCKCQEQRVDGFINPLSLQNTWRRRETGEGGGRLVRDRRRRCKGREGERRER